jgi:hypothetical protein
VSAREVSPFVGWHCSGAWGHVKCSEPCAWCKDEAAKNIVALSAAGYAVVPREPTREMWAASGNALANGRVKLKAHHDYLSETVWTAMLAASEPTR